jgi:hypothetical protein
MTLAEVKEIVANFDDTGLEGSFKKLALEMTDAAHQVGYSEGMTVAAKIQRLVRQSLEAKP